MDAGTIVTGARLVGDVAGVGTTAVKATAAVGSGLNRLLHVEAPTALHDAVNGTVELVLLFSRNGFNKASVVEGGGVIGRVGGGIGGRAAAQAAARAVVDRQVTWLARPLVRPPAERMAGIAGRAAGRVAGEPVGRAVTERIWDGTSALKARIAARRAASAAVPA
jgi:hypothetical protein